MRLSSPRFLHDVQKETLKTRKTNRLPLFPPRVDTWLIYFTPRYFRSFIWFGLPPRPRRHSSPWPLPETNWTTLAFPFHLLHAAFTLHTRTYISKHSFCAFVSLRIVTRVHGHCGHVKRNGIALETCIIDWKRQIPLKFSA